MLELAGVTVEYSDGPDKVVALDRANLSVTPGEFVALRGSSGSGKSTLLSVLAGLQRFATGSASLDGVKYESCTERQIADLRLRHLGVVFQDNNLIPELTASENVQLPLSARGMKKPQRVAESIRCLQEVGLSELSGRWPARLSGGQKQRVGIARALAGGKSYILADEPTGALDTVSSAQVFGVLRALADSGLGVVVASHDPKVLDWCDRDFELLDGRILYQRQAAELDRDNRV